jgi:Bacterial Ig domain
MFDQAPIAPATNSLSTAEDTAALAVAIGASDADGDSLSYALKSGAEPSKGEVSFADGSFTYTPKANANGADNFIILISDGNGGTAEQAVKVTINAVRLLKIFRSGVAANLCAEKCTTREQPRSNKSFSMFIPLRGSRGVEGSGQVCGVSLRIFRACPAAVLPRRSMLRS